MQDKNIILAITGGIAAYKSAELARSLIKQGANVQVVMTKAATEFITELTMQALTGRPVRTELFDKSAELGMGHIELARWADMIIIAPATANTIANLAHGMACDLISTLCLAIDLTQNKNIYIAPAMNMHMWQNPFVQDNISKLESIEGVRVISPEAGEQACGDIGVGRMAEVVGIVEYVASTYPTCRALSAVSSNEGRLSGFRGQAAERRREDIDYGQEIALNRNKSIHDHNFSSPKKILITAGPTKEAIDPVRYISNHSSGKMGYSIANMAAEIGFDVTVVSGPVQQSLKNNLNSRIKLIDITTADEMLASVEKNISDHDIFIGVAAVADYKFSEVSNTKIKKDSRYLELKLEKNPDIIKYVGNYKRTQNKDLKIIGFAAETDNLEQNALSKLHAKNLDYIVLNDIARSDIGFNSSYNQITIHSRCGKKIKYAKDTKENLALKIINLITEDILRTTDETRCENS